MAAEKTETVPNQVFIGLPWKTVKPKYEAVVDKLKTSSPLSFIIIGREEDQDAADLLELIKQKIDQSSCAIFDATDGNANVSLEYGYAEAKGIRRALYRSVRKKALSAKEKPIISDLAGKRQNHYKQVTQLTALMKKFSDAHAYTKRFGRFLASTTKRKSSGTKRRFRALALKVIHQLDGQAQARRVDVVQNVMGLGYNQEEVDGMIRKLHQAGLVFSQKGPHSTVWIV